MEKPSVHNLGEDILKALAAKLNADHTVNDETAKVPRIILRDPDFENVVRAHGYRGGPLSKDGIVYDGRCLLNIVYDSEAMTREETLRLSRLDLARRK